MQIFVTGALAAFEWKKLLWSVANGERSTNRGSCAQTAVCPYNSAAATL
jgi:hypothetical protein